MNDDHGRHVMAQAPLAGVVMCCTSIAPEQRSALASIAAQMGADHKYDLTSDVTHLVVGSIDTPKYKYVAKERADVKVVVPEFIEAVRRSWMEGGDTDVAALEVAYKVPTFFGLRICVTGFEDLSQRQKMAETVARHGAEYHGDLTKAVTHLMAALPKGKKYDYARQWGVRIVSLEWFSDSIERGMVLDETLYDPLLPPEERGQGAWNRTAVELVSLGKRPRQVERLLDTSDANRRKLRRTASAKLGSQSGLIWADITRGAADARRSTTERRDMEDLAAQGNRPPSVQDPARKEGSLAPRTLDVGTNDASVAPPDKSRGLFRGRIIHVHGFSRQKSSILREHLNSNGAKDSSDPKDLEGCEPAELAQGFVVIPHDVPHNKIPEASMTADGLCKVTEWWVETCLHRKTLVDPAGDVLCRPFTKLGIEGFEGMVIGSTGFTSIDLLHVSKVVNLMGARYDEYLKPSTSLLICSSMSPSREKLNYTLENNIPAVSAAWLWDCLQKGEKQPVDDYLITSSDEPVGKAPRTIERGDVAMNPAIELKKASASTSTRELHQSPDRIDLGHSMLKERKQQITSVKAGLPLPQDNGRRTSDAAAFSNPTDGQNPSDQPSRSSSLSDAPSKVFSPTPQPLEAPAPTVNSPKKSSHAISLPSPDATAATTAPKPQQNNLLHDATAPTAPPTSASPSENLHDSIAALLAHKQASSRTPSAPQSNRQRRRRGPLGRAPSLNSNCSHSMSCASSVDNSINANGNNGAAEQPLDEAGAGGQGQGMLGVEPQPSQALIYEDPDVQAQRERMVGKVKGKGAEARAAVKRIGVVRDVGDDEVGVAGRVRRRGRGAVG